VHGEYRVLVDWNVEVRPGQGKWAGVLFVDHSQLTGFAIYPKITKAQKSKDVGDQNPSLKYDISPYHSFQHCSLH
jgi:hypothetical protein